MQKPIDVFEHGRLLIGEQGFEKNHWEAFVKLNMLHNNEYFDVLHNGLRFKQYVGVIQVDGLLVNIHPKADKNDADEKWKPVLLQMLKTCGKLKAQSTGQAQLKRQQINLLEVYFEYYLNELEQLIRQGLVKKYRTEKSNVKALKGKLDFAGNLRYNFVHQERFYTSHQVYDRNHQLHQVLAYALNIVGQFSRTTFLNDKCKRIQLGFPEVDPMKPTIQSLEALQIDRKTSAYERALELAKLIILNYSPDINQGKQKMISILFDMNVLWEEYVLQILRNYANQHPDQNLKVTGQESKQFYGRYRSIRPDIVLEQDGTKYVIDTKWKRPFNNAASIEDLRQMYTYARFWNADKVMLLYPGEPYDSGYQHYPNNLDLFDQRMEHHRCKIGMVNVVKDGKLSYSLAEDILGLVVG
jgi:5-methylcytosine-specific restriction enzyme subunit McrC